MVHIIRTKAMSDITVVYAKYLNVNSSLYVLKVEKGSTNDAV